MDTSIYSAVDTANGFYVTNAILANLRSDVSDARIEACKTECAIQAAIQEDTNTNEINFRSLDNRICETEKSAIVFAKDAIIESLKSEARVTDRITDLSRSTDMQFCEVKTAIAAVNTHLTHQLDRQFAASMLETERGFNHLREEDLEEKIDACRREHDAAIQNANFNTQFAIIGSAIQNLTSQTQGLSNAVVQIGAANVAVPLNTQNNV